MSPNVELYRVVNHHHQRTESGNWISRNDAWRIIYDWSSLLKDEWIGIQARGAAVVVVKRGLWINTNRLAGNWDGNN